MAIHKLILLSFAGKVLTQPADYTTFYASCYKNYRRMKVGTDYIQLMCLVQNDCTYWTQCWTEWVYTKLKSLMTCFSTFQCYNCFSTLQLLSLLTMSLSFLCFLWQKSLKCSWNRAGSREWKNQLKTSLRKAGTGAMKQPSFFPRQQKKIIGYTWSYQTAGCCQREPDFKRELEI